jgi:hypothetical protein
MDEAAQAAERLTTKQPGIKAKKALKATLMLI